MLNNQIDAAKTLLDHGANVEDQAPDGTTALNMAIVNAYYDLASVLLDYKANPNAPDPRGSALHAVIWLSKPGASWEAAGLASGSRARSPPDRKGERATDGGKAAAARRESQRPYHLEGDAHDGGLAPLRTRPTSTSAGII